jgi:hypothetical protein
MAIFPPFRTGATEFAFPLGSRLERFTSILSVIALRRAVGVVDAPLLCALALLTAGGTLSALSVWLTLGGGIRILPLPARSGR